MSATKRKKTGTAIATTETAPPVQVVPAIQSLSVPIKFLQAALITSAKKDVRYYLNGVYVHAVDGEIRIAGTDGHRMIVSRFVPQEPIPEWAAAGFILGRDELAQALPVLAKNSAPYEEEPVAMIEHRPGEDSVTLRAFNGFASFVMRPIDGRFPEYGRVLNETGEQLARVDNDATDAAAIDTAYMKGAADVALRIGAKAIHSFVGRADKSVLFTFQGAPDTVLIVMPMRSGPAISEGAVKLLGTGSVSASVAALRAHLTRTTRLLDSATSKDEIEYAENKIAALTARINALVGGADKQIEHQATA